MDDLQFGLSTLISILAEVIVLILIAVRGRGRARPIGLVGAVIMLVGAIGYVVMSALAPYLFQHFRLPISIYPVLLVPISLLRGIGVVIVAVAVGTHAREVRAASRPLPQDLREPSSGGASTPPQR